MKKIRDEMRKLNGAFMVMSNFKSPESIRKFAEIAQRVADEAVREGPK